MVENLCTEWGERLACFEGKEYFAFPAIERLAGHNHYETFFCADYFCYGGDGPLYKEYSAIPAILTESLAEEGVEERLRELGFGYRAKYIQQSAQRLFQLLNLL